MNVRNRLLRWVNLRGNETRRACRRDRREPAMVAASSLLALLAIGCPSAVTPPPMEPTIAAPEAPRIPWLAAGRPDIAPPQIPWLTDQSACPLGWALTQGAPRPRPRHP